MSVCAARRSPFFFCLPLPPEKRKQSKLIKIIFIKNTSSRKTDIPPCASNFFFLPSAIARNRGASRHFHEKQERFRIRRSCYAPTRRPIRLRGHADSACRVDPTRFHDRTNGETDAEPSPDDFGRKGGRPRRQEQGPVPKIGLGPETVQGTSFSRVRPPLRPDAGRAVASHSGIERRALAAIAWLRSLPKRTAAVRPSTGRGT